MKQVEVTASSFSLGESLGAFRGNCDQMRPNELKRALVVLVCVYLHMDIIQQLNLAQYISPLRIKLVLCMIPDK